jgi:hypothetical protein
LCRGTTNSTGSKSSGPGSARVANLTY